MSDEYDNEGPFGGFGDEDEPTQDEIDADDEAAVSQQTASKPEDPPLSPEGQATATMLGLTPAEFRERVISRAARMVVGDRGIGYNDDLQKAVKATTEAAMTKFLNEEAYPVIKERIDTITFQATNQWGEPKAGQPAKTFREWMVDQASAYLTEDVDHNGKSMAECRARGDSFSRPYSTRVVHLVREHFMFSMRTAIEAAVKQANQSIVGGIEGAVKLALNDLAKSLKVDIRF